MPNARFSQKNIEFPYGEMKEAFNAVEVFHQSI